MIQYIVLYFRLINTTNYCIIFPNTTNFSGNIWYKGEAMYTVVFIDTEVSVERGAVLDYGAAVDGSTHIHTKSAKAFEDFLVQNSTEIGRAHV